MGPRFSPGIPAAGVVARSSPGGAGDGTDGDRHETCPGRYCPAFATAGGAVLRGEFQPAEPFLPGGTKATAGRIDSGVSRATTGRERHYLLSEPQKRRKPCGTTSRLGRGGAPLSCGPAGRGAGAEPGALSPRRRPGDLRDDRVRDGDQQTERAFRDSLRSAEEHRRILPGNGPGRPGWVAE